MVISNNHNGNHPTANGNLQTLAVLEGAGKALEAAGIATYTHTKQGTREQWVYHLGGRSVSVSYFYTPIAASWGDLYQREQGTFKCGMSWEEHYSFYSSLEQPVTLERAEALTLEQALGILRALLCDELGRAA